MILSSVRLKNIPEEQSTSFPWTLGLIQNFAEIEFQKNITFFVGENGSGKSTVLEGIAAASRVPIAGSLSIEEDESLAAALSLSRNLILSYHLKVNHGLFVRAEDFIGFARSIKNQIKELNLEIEEMKSGYKGGDIKLMIGPIEGEKQSLLAKYTADLEAMSHGEGFLHFFKNRLTTKGLYLIDEPEAALSPQRQLALIHLIRQNVLITDSQFIIATHSPLIMAMPESEVMYFANNTIQRVNYKETEHYQLSKGFMDDPELYLSRL